MFEGFSTKFMVIFLLFFYILYEDCEIVQHKKHPKGVTKLDFVNVMELWL